MKEFVSIVVPIYNMESSIDKTIDSLLSQDYENYEVILVDDGSTDRSYELCKIREKADKRIRTIHTSNQGSGPARNQGIENAKGKWIYFPDADDLLVPNALSKMMEGTNGGDCDLVVFGFRSIDTKGNIVSTKEYEDAVMDAEAIRKDYSECMTTSSRLGIQGAPWNKFFNLNVIRNNKVEFPPLRRHQDEGFIARYMCYARKVHFINEVLYTYYTNDLKREWQKYPVNYLDAVIGLNETRKKTILTWNANDAITHDMINREYICNVIKALELSFSPKMKLNRKERKVWIVESLKKTGIENVQPPSIVGGYQKLVLAVIRRQQYRILYYLLRLKIEIEKIVKK